MGTTFTQISAPSTPRGRARRVGVISSKNRSSCRRDCDAQIIPTGRVLGATASDRPTEKWLRIISAQESYQLRKALKILQPDESDSQKAIKILQSEQLVAFDPSVISHDMWAAKVKEISAQIASEQTTIYEPELKQMIAAADRAKTLADFLALRDVIDPSKFAEIDNRTVVGELERLMQDVTSLAWLKQTSDSHQLGLFFESISRVVRPDPPHRWFAKITAIRRDLILTVISQTQQLPGLSPKSSDETVAAILLRTADEATTKADTTRALRALEAYQNVCYTLSTPPPWLVSDIDGSRDFLGATNLHSAGQYAQSAQLCIAGLECTGPHVPINSLATLLNKIRTNHPEAANPTTRPTEAKVTPPRRN